MARRSPPNPDDPRTGRILAGVPKGARGRNKTAVNRATGTQVKLRPPRAREVRAQIQCTMILRRLHGFIEGKWEMSREQVAAAKILLDKALPSLENVTMQDEDGRNQPMLIQWAPIVARAEAVEADRTIDGEVSHAG